MLGTRKYGSGVDICSGQTGHAAPWLFQYVETSVPRQTGERFNPHVTIGVAPLDWLEELEQKPFDTFAFDATGIATYQLGNFGTASKRLDRSQ